MDPAAALGYDFMPRYLSILHLIPNIGPRSFGLGPVALNLALEQLRAGHSVEIWCLDTPEDQQWASESSGFPVNRINAFSTIGPSSICFSPALEKAIVGATGLHFDILHQHGIWTANTRVTNAWRKRTGKPTVITTHGYLQPWCLRKSAMKKRIALLGYEQQNFSSAACFHALSKVELDDCRAFGLRNPMVIIPNGVGDEWLESDGCNVRFRKQYNIPEDKTVAFFLSRITPKKGLPMLFQAIDALRDSLDNWLFLIGGVDEFTHQVECERIVAERKLESYVRFIGPLFGDVKRDAFAAADLFILPSHSEGAPIAILEALGAGTPVLTTKASPWEDLITHQCGWWTETTVDGVTSALCEATGKTREELCIMGERGKRLVAERYTWKESARKTILLYEWLLGQGEKPEFVRTE